MAVTYVYDRRACVLRAQLALFNFRRRLLSSHSHRWRHISDATRESFSSVGGWIELGLVAARLLLRGNIFCEFEPGYTVRLILTSLDLESCSVKHSVI